jgi:WD40 repeat protein
MSVLGEQRRGCLPEHLDLRLGTVVTGMAFLDNGVLAIAGGDGTVRLLAFDGTTSVVQAHEKGAAALTLALDIDGAAVLTGGDDGRLVRTSASGSTATLFEAVNRQIEAIATHRPSGRRAVAFGKDIRLIDRAGRATGETANHPSTVTGLSFNPKGKRLAASHYDGVTLWPTDPWVKDPKRLSWRGSHIAVSWSPDGSTVMSATQEADLHGWRLADGRDMQMCGYAIKVRSLDWIRKPLMLVTAGGDCVTAWRFTGGGPMGTEPLLAGRGVGRLVTAVAARPQGPWVAAGFDDGRLALCELPGERSVRLRPTDGGRMVALAWSRDGRHLASGTKNGVIALFDLSSLSCHG